MGYNTTNPALTMLNRPDIEERTSSRGENSADSADTDTAANTAAAADAAERALLTAMSQKTWIFAYDVPWGVRTRM